MQMMGGKLEDRSDQEEKVELVRPDWMNKPKEEMNEEERKLVKEFEKKVATFKEEQEKYKKALETELRKLQSAITEICDNFDKSLSEFFNSRIRNDQIIYQTELKLIKLNQTSVFGEHDELKEQEIITRLEHLKGEKMAYMAEIPEIKVEPLLIFLERLGKVQRRIRSGCETRQGSGTSIQEGVPLLRLLLRLFDEAV